MCLIVYLSNFQNEEQGQDFNRQVQGQDQDFIFRPQGREQGQDQITDSVSQCSRYCLIQ